MEYQEPIKEKPVTDYDFTFAGGGRLPLTLEAEDAINELPDRFVVDIAIKPNLFDPDNPIPGETITIFKQHLTAFLVRKRMQRLPSTDESFDMKQVIHNMTKTIQ